MVAVDYILVVHKLTYELAHELTLSWIHNKNNKFDIHPGFLIFYIQ